MISRTLSLRARIAILIGGTIIGLATAILVALGFAARCEISRAVKQDVASTGRVLKKILSERSLSLVDQSRLIASHQDVPAALQSRNPGSLDQHARQWRSLTRADFVMITDTHGRELGSTETESDMSPGFYAGIKQSLRGGCWTGVVSRGQRLILAISVPVRRDGSGEVLGAFVVGQTIDDFLAGELKAALGTNVAFVNHWRVVGASTRTGATLPAPKQSPEVIEVLGEEYFALYSPLPGTSPDEAIGFVVMRQYTRAMDLFYRFQLVFMVIAAIALLHALMAAAAVSASIAQPLEGVVRAARTLKEGNWPERFTVTRDDEIGLLKSAFNEMTDSLRAAQERMLALIDIDPLTSLSNHRQFVQRLANQVRCAAENGEPLSLLILNVDGFKEFNRQFGHGAGDEILKTFAARISASVPECAVCARYAGDVFAVLLPRHSSGEAEKIAIQLRADIAELWAEGPSVRPPTLSIGCSSIGPQVPEGDALLLAAELALSQAKELGRDRVCRFENAAWGDVGDDPYKLHRFLKDGSLATIQALAAAVDAKDSYTKGHSARVAHLAADLAAFMGMAETDVENIRVSGTLHDVGKIGVPDSILSKDRMLSDNERDLMETHPVLGEVIVRKASRLGATLPGVRNHHERWDGRGYPDRLREDEIPLIARIIAIADAYDAMTTDRPYRNAMSRKAALDEIAKHAGTQFDPHLVQLFFLMMAAKARIAAEALPSC